MVRSSSDIDRTCSIRWFSGNGEELEIEDDVSVYDLTENADMVFNPGDLVIAVSCRNEGDAQEHGVAGQVIRGYLRLIFLRLDVFSLFFRHGKCF